MNSEIVKIYKNTTPIKITVGSRNQEQLTGTKRMLKIKLRVYHDVSATSWLLSYIHHEILQLYCILLSVMKGLSISDSTF